MHLFAIRLVYWLKQALDRFRFTIFIWPTFRFVQHVVLLEWKLETTSILINFYYYTYQRGFVHTRKYSHKAIFIEIGSNLFNDFSTFLHFYSNFEFLETITFEKSLKDRMPWKKRKEEQMGRCMNIT